MVNTYTVLHSMK